MSSTPISVVFEFPHDSVDGYFKVFENGGREIVEQSARLHHQCWETSEGFTVVDIWESEDAFARFGEVLVPQLQALGLNAVPKINPTRRIVTQAGDVQDY